MSFRRYAPAGHLADLVVLEIGDRVAGTVLGQLLADQGARTTKISRRALRERHPAAASWNRAKRVLEADDVDAAAVEELVRGADVLIDATVEGSPHRIGAERATALNERIVFVSLPAMSGRDLPVDEPDGLVGALTAAHQLSDKDETIRYNTLLMPSLLGAARAASAVLAALRNREATGTSQVIEVSLYEAMLLAWGRHLVRKGRSVETGPRLPLVAQYRAADGRWVQLHGNYEPKWSRIILEAGGRPDLVAEAETVVREARADAATDALWRQRFSDLIATKPSDYWEREISAAGGACTICRPMDEWLAHEHPREAGLLVELETGDGGTAVVPGLAVDIEPPTDADTAPPARVVGQPGRPLAGLRVIDLTILIAGPTAGRTLAEYGADVIKIDDPHRVPSEWSWEDANRGKRSALIDLKTDAGADAFWRLLESADVVLTNFRPGRMGALGIGFEQVARRRPGITYLSMNAYGHDGPWSDLPGWEQLVQAASGIEVRRAEPGGKPQVVTPWISDYGAGLLGAFGVMLALRDRDRNGPASRHVRTSLAQSAALMQSRFLHAGLAPGGFGAGFHPFGESATSALYEAADGWIYVEAPDREALLAPSAFDAVRGSAASLADDALREAVAAVIATAAREAWQVAYAGSVVQVAPVRILRELAHPHDLEGGGRVAQAPHPGEGTVQYLETFVRGASAEGLTYDRAPMPGEHTKAILAEAGFGADEVVGLYEQGAAFDRVTAR